MVSDYRQPGEEAEKSLLGIQSILWIQLADSVDLT
jgi:hypothetical protein